MFRINVATKTNPVLVIMVKILDQTLLSRLVSPRSSKRLLCKNTKAKGMKDTAKEVMTIGW